MTFNEKETEIIAQALRTYYGFLISGESNTFDNSAREIFHDKIEQCEEMINRIELRNDENAHNNE